MGKTDKLCWLAPLFCFFIMPNASAQSSDPSLIDRGFGPFERSLNDRPHGYNVISPHHFPYQIPSEILAPNETPGQTPDYYEKFEVRAGDCGAHRTWNDCEKDRERSELSEKGSRNPLGSEFIYEWSFYIPKNFPNISPAKTIITQFHQEKSSPVWIFTLEPGLYLERRLYGRLQEKHLLLSSKQLREQWHKVKVHVAWQDTEKGFFFVSINGKQKLNYRGVTMQAKNTYLKYGIYRAFISRYFKLHNTSKLPTQTLFFANIKRSISP